MHVLAEALHVVHGVLLLLVLKVQDLDLLDLLEDALRGPSLLHHLQVAGGYI